MKFSQFVEARVADILDGTIKMGKIDRALEILDVEDLETEIKDKVFKTAIKFKRYDIFEALVDHGANVDKALDFAKSVNDKKAISILEKERK
jgi:tRNA splicing endonuclease